MKVNRCQIPYKRFAKLSRKGEGYLGYLRPYKWGLSYAKAELKRSKRRFKHTAIHEILTYKRHSILIEVFLGVPVLTA